MLSPPPSPKGTEVPSPTLSLLYVAELKSSLCTRLARCTQARRVCCELWRSLVPDHITRRNASQRLKLRAFRPGGPSSNSKGLELGALHILNAQGLSIYLEMVADEGQSDEPQSILS